MAGPDAHEEWLKQVRAVCGSSDQSSAEPGLVEESLSLASEQAQQSVATWSLQRQLAEVSVDQS